MTPKTRINPDQANYQYEAGIVEIIDIVKTLNEKINEFHKETEKIDEILSYYDLLKEDISHIQEMLVMKPQIVSKLNTRGKQILKRRREIKNTHTLINSKKIYSNFDILKDSTEDIAKFFDSHMKTSENKYYNIRTDVGAEILDELISEGVKKNIDAFRIHSVAEEVVEVEEKDKSEKEIVTNLATEIEKDPDKASLYYVRRIRKAWGLFDTRGSLCISHKKLANVMDYIVDQNIALHQIIVEDSVVKINFEKLYLAKVSELEYSIK